MQTLDMMSMQFWDGEPASHKDIVCYLSDLLLRRHPMAQPRRKTALVSLPRVSRENAASDRQRHKGLFTLRTNRQPARPPASTVRLRVEANPPRRVGKYVVQQAHRVQLQVPRRFQAPRSQCILHAQTI